MGPVERVELERSSTGEGGAPSLGILLPAYAATLTDYCWDHTLIAPEPVVLKVGRDLWYHTWSTRSSPRRSDHSWIPPTSIDHVLGTCLPHVVVGGGWVSVDAGMQ